MVSQDRRFRMWGLVGWLATAALGVACSEPRSLVQLDVNVDTSAMALDMSNATMNISFEQNGDLIRKVEKSLNELVPAFPESKKFQIGVYLPAHVSGEVKVVVVIVENNCPIGSTETKVTVTAGAATGETTVTGIVTEPSCSTDGGAPPPTAHGGLDTQEAG